MTVKNLKKSLKYEVIDNFLNNDDFQLVSSENEALHERAVNNTFSELSTGKTTVKFNNVIGTLRSTDITLSALTSEKIKKIVKNFIGIDTQIYTLLDFDERAGHSFFHRMFPKSFLGLHVDRSYLPETEMVKVANALFYTSNKWENSYGGHLYLQDDLILSEKERIEYKPNRLVVFLHTSKTFHGVSPLSKDAPNRYSAYMDFYVPASILRRISIGDQFWCHDTVYLPELRHIIKFLRGTGYSLELIRYLRKRHFAS